MIHLEIVNNNTFSKVIKLKVTEEQKQFVAENIKSLAQAWLYYKTARPYAILNDDEVVGFLMVDWDEEERTMGIWRFMIDTKWQNQGFGRIALERIIEIAKQSKVIDLIHLSYVIGNDFAYKLYLSFGFQDTDIIEENERLMIMKITDDPHVGSLITDLDDLDEINDFIEALESNNINIPSKYQKNELERLCKNNELIKFTIYGDVIGISSTTRINNNDYLILNDSKKYENEIIDILKK